ncbi:MAG: hypothetical protein H7124_16520 [Phycisphaerales bacterium]|nr:hypothetical protein [Hyphomonadaceae bacterium]
MSDTRKAIYFGAAGSVALTALLATRFDGSLAVLLLTPLLFGLCTLLSESVIQFKHGTGFGRTPGIGIGGWMFLCFAAFALFLSLVT